MHWKSTERSITTTVRPSKALKNANWEVVEHQTLHQQAQYLSITLETVLASLNPTTCTKRLFLQARAVIKDVNIDRVLSNRIKEKRRALSYCILILCSSFHQQQESFSTMTSPHEPAAG